MNDRRTKDIPPGSTVLRELCTAIDKALTLPKPAAERDEVTYLRISRDRARAVREAVRAILRDRYIEDDPRDVMTFVVQLHEVTEQLGDDTYDHQPEPTR